MLPLLWPLQTFEHLHLFAASFGWRKVHANMYCGSGGVDDVDCCCSHCPLLCWKALLIIWNTSRNSTFSFEMHFHTKLYSARNPSRCGHLVQAFTFKIGLVFHHYRPYVYVRTFNFISICFAHVYPLCKQLDVIDNLIFSRQAVIKHRQTCADIDTWNGRRIYVLT